MERDLSCATRVKVLHFGAAPKTLFGALHPAQTTSAKRTAVLLCNPFGEEAVRAHRIYRVFANRLSRAGFPTLRFDYFGTGDSAGAAEEATLDDWIDDVVRAASELRSQTGASRVAVVGLRLGATLATLATLPRDGKPRLAAQHVLLWDPVIDGAVYLRELAASHAEYMSEEMGEGMPPPRANAAGHPEESLGHPLSAQLSSAIARIDLDAPRADAVTVVVTKSGDETQRFERRIAKLEKAGKWIATTTSVPWNSDAAVNNAVVPADVLETLIGRIQELGA